MPLAPLRLMRWSVSSCSSGASRRMYLWMQADVIRACPTAEGKPRSNLPIKVEQLLEQQPELPRELEAMGVPDPHHVHDEAVHLLVVDHHVGLDREVLRAVRWGRGGDHQPLVQLLDRLEQPAGRRLGAVMPGEMPRLQRREALARARPPGRTYALRSLAKASMSTLSLVAPMVTSALAIVS